MKGNYNQADIARQLGIPTTTVFKDFRYLDNLYQQQMTLDTIRHKSLDLRRIEDIIAELWPKRGQYAVARTILQCLERKATMLGMDAPTVVDLTGWRAEASRAGVNPDDLFQDMIGMVAQKLGVLPAMPILDVTPEPEDDDEQGGSGSTDLALGGS
jgi:hypothetical protein